MSDENKDQVRIDNLVIDLSYTVQMLYYSTEFESKQLHLWRYQRHLVVSFRSIANTIVIFKETILDLNVIIY